jgi:hypothetical protein
MLRSRFKQLSNDIQAAQDTGNLADLEQLDCHIADALASGDINLPEAGELTADCEIAISAVERGNY